MAKQIKKQAPLIQNQNVKDVLAIALSNLLGTSLVQKADYDKVLKEKRKLLAENKTIENLEKKYYKSHCYFLMFMEYHKIWKPKTRNIEKRLKKLTVENLYIDFNEYPKDISENLKEAYNCYINGLNMACYIMILRTIEITVNIIYEQNNKPELDTNGRIKFIQALNKLNWVKDNKMIGGFEFRLAKSFIEARNESIHEVYVPTEKQIMSAFETAIILIKNLKPNIKKAIIKL